jgi:uncharacterized membrane protein (DUF373 family)
LQLPGRTSVATFWNHFSWTVFPAAVAETRARALRLGHGATAWQVGVRSGVRFSQEKWVARSTDAFVWVEHCAYVALGILLSLAALLALGGAAAVLIEGLGEWSSTHEIYLIIDRLLFVLMLIEILHTVRASMGTGELNAQPFLVVGLIASIRRVLLITLQSSAEAREPTMSEGASRMFQASMIELGVLTVLILVMVVSLWILRRQRRPVGSEESKAL